MRQRTAAGSGARVQLARETPTVILSCTYPCLILPESILETVRLAIVVHGAVWVLGVSRAQDGRQRPTDGGDSVTSHSSGMSG